MARLCLNMIVKDESAIIAETLQTICRSFPIDYWVISDTGSTDATKSIIQDTMARLGIAGELYEDAWSNFGDNRQLALEHATGKAAYHLFFDADDTIEGEVRIPFEQGQDAFYANFSSEDGGTHYQRLLVVRDGVAKWRGVLHEFVELAPECAIGELDGDYQVISRRLGNRSQQADKYAKDAALLAQAIEEGRDPDLYARYLFYCAQSYRDAGMTEQARYWYLKRAQETSGWSQERYISYLNLGFLAEGEEDEAKALYYWALAANLDSSRIEAWYHQARLHHWKGRAQLGYLFARKGADLTVSAESLFVETDIYAYWMAYENFILGFDTGDWERSYHYLKQVIAAPAPCHLYLNQEERIRHLASFAQKDSYEEVYRLMGLLQEKKSSQVMDWLGLA